MALHPTQIIEKRRELWNEHKDIEKDKDFVEAVARAICTDDFEGALLRKEISGKPSCLIEMCFVIADKNMQTVPFFLNDVQRSFDNDLTQAILDYKAGKRLHLAFLVLKGRQQGFTSYITGRQTATAIITRNFSGFTLADDGDNTTTIFEDKAKFPYNQLPDLIKPVEKYNTRQELHFAALNSRWRCATAGKKSVGRSKTINFFHGSEAAFWPSLNFVLTSLGPALTKDCIKILETTANGFDDFQILWEEAEQRYNNWEPKFYEWWLTPEYRLPFENEFVEADFKKLVFKPETPIHDRCKWLLEDKKLDWQQLYWYYNKWKDMKKSSKASDNPLGDLPQEYPCTADEAFLSSGKPVFDISRVMARKQYLKNLYEKKKPFKGSFTYEYKNQMIVDSSIRLKEDINGFVTIYKTLEPRKPYVIGSDIAEGGADFSSGQVRDNMTGEQAATWHGHTESDQFAKQMYCLGRYFNNALIAIEVNFDKHPVKELQRLGYGNQYRRETVDQITGQRQQKYGFLTTSQTRPLAIAKTVTLVRESVELINDIQTLNEMISYVRDEHGRPDHMEGHHDDLILGLAISEMARDQQSRELLPVYNDNEEETVNHFGRVAY